MLLIQAFEWLMSTLRFDSIVSREFRIKDTYPGRPMYSDFDFSFRCLFVFFWKRRGDFCDNLDGAFFF